MYRLLIFIARPYSPEIIMNDINDCPSFMVFCLHLASAHRSKRSYTVSPWVREEMESDIAKFRKLTELAYRSDFGLRYIKSFNSLIKFLRKDELSVLFI